MSKKNMGAARKRLYESAMQAALKLADYFDNIDFTATDARGNPIYKATDVMRTLKDVGETLTTLKDLEEKVEKDEFSKGKTIKGRKINPFEKFDKSK